MARKKLPYYEMYPADFDTDENVRLMNDTELGFYLRCLNHAWLNGSIPSDPEELARVMKTPLREVRALMQRVGKCFRESSPGRLVNPRQEEQREEARMKSETARQSAKDRWSRVQNGCETDANASPPQSERNAYQRQHQRQHQNQQAAAAAYEKFPAAAAAVREHFPTSDGELFAEIAERALAVRPELSDGDLTAAIHEARSRKPNQREATLFIRTVPEVIRTWQG